MHTYGCSVSNSCIWKAEEVLLGSSRRHEASVVQKSGARKGKPAKLNINQILYTGSIELSCSAGSFRNISFIVHRGAHNSVLLLEFLHGRNSQTQLAALLFLKWGCTWRLLKHQSSAFPALLPQLYGISLLPNTYIQNSRSFCLQEMLEAVVTLHAVGDFFKFERGSSSAKEHI